MRQACALILAAVLLSACGGSVYTDVTAFHRLTPPMSAGKTVAIEPAENDLKDSLEFADYRSKIAERFAKQGVAVVEGRERADWIAFLRYGVDGGKDEPYSYTSPTYGKTGGGTTYHSGAIGGGYGSGSSSYSGTSYTPPTYGVTGYTTHSGVRRNYMRFIGIDIVDRVAFESGQSSKLYEGKVESTSTCSSLVRAFLPMADNLFDGWPGESGKARRSQKIVAAPC